MVKKGLYLTKKKSIRSNDASTSDSTLLLSEATANLLLVRNHVMILVLTTALHVVLCLMNNGIKIGQNGKPFIG